MSAEPFLCDAFLSHSAREKAVVRPPAERRRDDRSVITVAVGGFNPFPEGALAQGLQHVVGESARLELIEH
jgi:hypothetical protein